MLDHSGVFIRDFSCSHFQCWSTLYWHGRYCWAWHWDKGWEGECYFERRVWDYDSISQWTKNFDFVLQSDEWSSIKRGGPTTFCPDWHCCLLQSAWDVVSIFVHNAQSHDKRLTLTDMYANLIPLWEWTWCHRVFYVRQDWNVRSIVRSQENTCATTKRRSWSAGTLLETRCDITSILKVVWSLGM